MKKQELEAFAREVAKGLKTEEDLNEFSQLLTIVTVEAALNAELEDHLGYARHFHRRTPTAATATAARRSPPAKASLNWRRRVTGTAASSRSW